MPTSAMQNAWFCLKIDCHRVYINFYHWTAMTLGVYGYTRIIIQFSITPNLHYNPHSIRIFVAQVVSFRDGCCTHIRIFEACVCLCKFGWPKSTLILFKYQHYPLSISCCNMEVSGEMCLVQWGIWNTVCNTCVFHEFPWISLFMISWQPWIGGARPY